jgi:antitoxin YefM
MYTEIHIKADELDESFLKSIRSLFKKKRISIIVEEEQDETEYLLKSEANRKMLMQSIRQSEKGELVSVNIGKGKKK